MGRINWGRVVLCGIAAGGIFSFLALATDFFALGETEYMQAIQAGYGRGLWPWALGFVLDLVGGIWTMWLYAAIRPRYGAGPKTAAVAGLAVWIPSTLFGVQFALLQLIPLPLGELVVPLAAYLPLRLVASVVGAWHYKE